MLIPLQELIRKHRIKPTGILHVGANTGQEAKDYYECGVKRVIWVEAAPDLIPFLKQHVKKYPFLVNAVLQACVSDEDGKEVTFNVANNGGQSSSILELATHAVVHPEVKYVANYTLKTNRLDSILKYNKINIQDYDFLNLDIQGAELLALHGMGELLHKVKYIYTEVNEKELYAGCALIDEVDIYLSDFGFTRIETEMAGNFGWGDAFYMREG